MENSMARGMTQRYEDYLNTRQLEERAAKGIYYWVMSTLEFLFWTMERKVTLNIDLFASEEKIYLVFRDKNGTKHEIVYIPRENYYGKLLTILQNFVKTFNNIKYPLSEKINSPTFHALYSEQRWSNNDKYKNYYHICIMVDMLPED